MAAAEHDALRDVVGNLAHHVADAMRCRREGRDGAQWLWLASEAVAVAERILSQTAPISVVPEAGVVEERLQRYCGVQYPADTVDHCDRCGAVPGVPCKPGCARLPVDNWID
jgi:hypothetical protein